MSIKSDLRTIRERHGPLLARQCGELLWSIDMEDPPARHQHGKEHACAHGEKGAHGSPGSGRCPSARIGFGGQPEDGGAIAVSPGIMPERFGLGERFRIGGIASPIEEILQRPSGNRQGLEARKPLRGLRAAALGGGIMVIHHPSPGASSCSAPLPWTCAIRRSSRKSPDVRQYHGSSCAGTG